MHLRNLRYFCAAYEERSTVGAARACHVTQPVISGAIAQLEEELGVQLFVRQQRGLAPTAAAQRLYRLGGKLLADAQAISESFRDSTLNPQLALRVLPALNIEHTRRLLQQLRREIPRLALRLPGAGEPCDATLTSDQCADRSATFLALWEEAYALVVPHDHPLAVQESITLGDLHNVAFIERSHCEMHEVWQTAMGQHKVVPDVRARAQSEEWALGLVAAGVGVTIMPLHALVPTQGVVVRDDVTVLQGFKRSIGLAYHAHEHAAEAGILADVLRVCRRWVDARWQPVPPRLPVGDTVA